MGKKQLKRIMRSGELPKDQIAKDRKVRRKVQEEFPPVPNPPSTHPISESLKKAIKESNISVYEIAKRAHVSQIMISRFMSGERDIRMATADKLANVLGLKLLAAL